jgi:hypothetical protein
MCTLKAIIINYREKFKCEIPNQRMCVKCKFGAAIEIVVKAYSVSNSVQTLRVEGKVLILKRSVKCKQTSRLPSSSSDSVLSSTRTSNFSNCGSSSTSRHKHEHQFQQGATVKVGGCFVSPLLSAQ